MSVTAIVPTTIVFAACMIPGPIIILTAERSLTARLMTSPDAALAVPAGGEPQEVREEVLAHLELHVARGADQDPPGEEEEDRVRRREAQDRRAGEGDEPGRGVRLERLEDVPDDPRHREEEGGGERHRPEAEGVLPRAAREVGEEAGEVLQGAGMLPARPAGARVPGGPAAILAPREP